MESEKRKKNVFFSPQNYVIAPLHVAAKYGNLNIVTLLVEKGSKVDIPNKVSWIMMLIRENWSLVQF